MGGSQTGEERERLRLVLGPDTRSLNSLIVSVLLPLPARPSSSPPINLPLPSLRVCFLYFLSSLLSTLSCFFLLVRPSSAGLLPCPVLPEALAASH